MFQKQKVKNTTYFKFSMVSVLIAVAGFATLQGSEDVSKLYPTQGLPGFSVGSFGNAQISYRLNLPAGTGNAVPGLSIGWSRGKTIIPGGWQVSGFHYVERDRSNGIFYNGSDKYISSLGGKLIEVSPGVYRHKNDNGIELRAIGQCGSGPCEWQASMPDGTEIVFGNTPDSFFASGENASDALVWGMSEQRYKNGNYWTVSYRTDTGAAIYPDRIEYTKNDTAGLTPRIVQFQYENRDVKETAYGGGTVFKYELRLKTVEASGGGGSISYQLDYDSPDGGRTERLTSFREYVNGEELRSPVSFSYTGWSTGKTSRLDPVSDMGLGNQDEGICSKGEAACLYVATAVPNPENPLYVNAKLACDAFQLYGEQKRCNIGVTYNYGDVNGDGRVDFIRAFGTWGSLGRFGNADRVRVRFSSENGRGHEGAMSENQLYGTPGTQAYIDLNGDGRADYVRMKIGAGTSIDLKYYVSYSNGETFGAMKTWRLPTSMEPRGNLLDLMRGADVIHFVTWGDVNGDGKLELIRLIEPGKIGVAFVGNNGFTNHPVITSGLDTGIESKDHAFQTMADFNGDGIQDFIALAGSPGAYRLAVSLGKSNGKFASTFYTRTISDPGPRRFRHMGDVNGDGLADFVRVSSNNSSRVITSFSSGTDLIGNAANNLGTGSIDEETGAMTGGTCSLGKAACTYALSSFANPTSSFVQSLLQICAAFKLSGTEASCNSRKTWTIADANGDGKGDFIRYVEVGEDEFVPRVTLFHGGSFKGSSYNLSKTTASKKSVQYGYNALADINGDGRPEFIVPDDDRGLSINGLRGGTGDLLTEVDDSRGKTISLEYESTTNAKVSDPDSNRDRGDYSVRADVASRYIIKSATISGISGPRSKTEYSYSGGKMVIGPNRDESKMLGFAQVTEKGYSYDGNSFRQDPMYKVTDYFQDHPTLGYDAAGMVESEKVMSVQTGKILQQTEYSYVRPVEYSFGALKKIAVKAKKTVDSTTNIEMTSLQEISEFDEYGNPVRIFEDDDTRNLGDDHYLYMEYEYPAEYPNGRIKSKTISGRSGSTITYEGYNYDSNGNLIIKKNGPSPGRYFQTEYTYNAAGMPASKTENGLTTTYEYDAETMSFVTAETLPGNGTIHRSYDKFRGLLLQETDPGGSQTNYVYDDLGRPVVTKRGAGSLLGYGEIIINRTEYDYTSDGSLQVRKYNLITNNEEYMQESTYDEWFRLKHDKKEGDSGFIKTDIDYDIFGRETSRSLPYSEGDAPIYLTTIFSELGQPVERDISTPNGIKRITNHPENLEQVTFISNRGVSLTGYATEKEMLNGQRVYVYNTVDGRTIQKLYETAYTSIQSPSSSETKGWTRIRYHYDGQERLREITRGTGTGTSIIDNPVLTIKYEYDEYGRKIAEYDPDKGRTQYTYNEYNLPECDHLPDYRSLCRDYDTEGRLIRMRHGQGGAFTLAEYFYDETESSFGKGRLTSIKDDSGTQRFHYDPYTGQVERSTRKYKMQIQVDAGLGGHHSGETEVEFETIREYSPSGVLLSVSYPASGMTIGYNYQGNGTIKSIGLSDNENRITSESPLTLAEFGDYDVFGSPRKIKYANGVVQNYETNSFTGQRMREEAGKESLSGDIGGSYTSYEYNYSDDGNLIRKMDLLQTNDTNLSQSYKYDIAHRLIEATGPFGNPQSPVHTLTFAYGPDGQPTIFNNQTSVYGDHPHRLKEQGRVKYEYDAEKGPGNGNVDRRIIEGKYLYPDQNGNPSTAMPETGTDGIYTVDSGKSGNGPCSNPGMGPGSAPGHNMSGHENNGNVPCQDNGTNTDTVPVQGEHNVVQEFEYNEMNRPVTARIYAPGKNEHRIKFIYDAGGNRFAKIMEEGGPFYSVVYPEDDYRIVTTESSEYHVIFVRGPQGDIATFTFENKFHLAGGITASTEGSKLAQNIRDLLFGGKTTNLALSGITTHGLAYAKLIAIDSAIWFSVAEIVGYLAILGAFPYIIYTWIHFDINGIRRRKSGNTFISFEEEGAGVAESHGNLIKETIFRSTALTLLIAFYSLNIVSCSNSAKDQNPGAIPPGGGGLKLSDIAYLGGHFYTTNDQGSVELVTNANGIIVRKYVYTPYGDVNLSLSAADPDGDGEVFNAMRLFTGQEFDYELGMYNYQARLYDPWTGRFMQTDPIHSDRDGYDVYDRYSYVGGDPVNYIDPDGMKTCSKQVVAIYLGIYVGLIGTAAFGVTGNYTGGGGACTTRMPREKEALMFVLLPYMSMDSRDSLAIGLYSVLYYYKNYMQGNGPSFLGKMSNTELQFFLLGQMSVVQNNDDPRDDMFPVIAYFLMREMVANPRFAVDDASFFHDQYGPKVFDPKNRKATSRWIKSSVRAVFSHDSWSNIYSREKKATPKWWGDARGVVATINTAFSWVGQAVMTITGSVLFGIANAITGTKNLDKPGKWRL